MKISHLTCLLLLPFYFWALASPVFAQTGGFFEKLYGDHRALQVGDTLHLIISESANAQMNIDQSQGQGTEAETGPGLGKLTFLPMFGFSGSTKSSAQGSSTRNGTVTARMTVSVVEVSPGGNLVVEGQRTVSVNHDKEIINIRGEVRRKDVRPDNTIYSYNLANVEVDYAGSDPRKPNSKVGIISRLLNFIF